jgi:hypothetical protein
MRSNASAAFSSGYVSIIGFTPVSALNFSVSSESIPVPDAQPAISRFPMIKGSAFTISGTRSAMPQAVVGGYTGAHQRSRIHIGQVAGNQRQRIRRSHHVIGVSPVEGDAGNLLILAENEVAPAARRAVVAVPAMPAQAHALANFEKRHIRSHGVHHARNLVPRDARIGNAGKEPELRDRIAVANSTSLDADTHMSRPRPGKLSLYNLKRTTRGGYLHCATRN